MKIEKSKFSFFSFFQEISIFLRISYEQNFVSKKYFPKNIFRKKNETKSGENFQIDITSSDLNEFLIGCKFWKAESLL